MALSDVMNQQVQWLTPYIYNILTDNDTDDQGGKANPPSGATKIVIHDFLTWVFKNFDLGEANVRLLGMLLAQKRYRDCVRTAYAMIDAILRLPDDIRRHLVKRQLVHPTDHRQTGYKFPTPEDAPTVPSRTPGVVRRC